MRDDSGLGRLNYDKDGGNRPIRRVKSITLCKF